jgi:quercetin dioxygenase-like cupin family protein
MHLLDFTPGHDTLISVYKSHGAYALPLGEGRGEGHVYRIRIEPGGAIGSHEAAFGQLFLIVAGSGWVSGGDGIRRPIGAGQGAFIGRGEVHAKGSDTGLTAIMVQLTDLAVAPAAINANGDVAGADFNTKVVVKSDKGPCSAS